MGQTLTFFSYCKLIFLPTLSYHSPFHSFPLFYDDFHFHMKDHVNILKIICGPYKIICACICLFLCLCLYGCVYLFLCACVCETPIKATTIFCLTTLILITNKFFPFNCQDILATLVTFGKQSAFFLICNFCSTSVFYVFLSYSFQSLTIFECRDFMIWLVG